MRSTTMSPSIGPNGAKLDSGVYLLRQFRQHVGARTGDDAVAEPDALSFPAGQRAAGPAPGEQVQCPDGPSTATRSAVATRTRPPLPARDTKPPRLPPAPPYCVFPRRVSAAVRYQRCQLAWIQVHFGTGTLRAPAPPPPERSDPSSSRPAPASPPRYRRVSSPWNAARPCGRSRFLTTGGGRGRRSSAPPKPARTTTYT